MTQASFFTPSYLGDLERAVWMRRSLRTFFRGEAEHIMAVPHRDLPDFRRRLGHEPNLMLIAQEELVDKCFYPDRLHQLIARIAPRQVWRFNDHAGRPGWIIQQIVKLSSPSLVTDGAIIFVDSDLFFFQPFDFDTLGMTHGRLLVRRKPESERAQHPHHVVKAREILFLPAERCTDQAYMASPAIWYADWAKQLHLHLEQVSGKPWQRALYDAGHISEYTLYGIFLEEVLKPAGLMIRDKRFNLMAWDRASFVQLKSALLQPEFQANDYISLVFQSNAGIPTTEYEDLLRHILDKAEVKNT